MSKVQARGEAMIDRHGFLGVPRATFERGGRAQFVRLLENGLTPESKLLDIGCGCLRVAYWLIRFLEPDGYFGIEPARLRVEYGKHFLFESESEELERKRPRFDFNAGFDSKPFATVFDFFLAGSIWTHASKAQIETTLDSFCRDAAPSAAFLSSYLPAATPEEDYSGDSWVGSSHESATPGIVRHSLAWISAACERRGLALGELPGLDCDSQYWLRITKRPTGL
jgi:hypothetical protein